MLEFSKRYHDAIKKQDHYHAYAAGFITVFIPGFFYIVPWRGQGAKDQS